MLQALYFCRPFRENVLAYKAQQKKKENLLTCLADLFHSIATQKKKVGVIPPKKFISRLRKENGEQPSELTEGGFDFKPCSFLRRRKQEAAARRQALFPSFRPAEVTAETG